LDFAFWYVLLAIEANDRAFFIDFGKYLSGEIKDSTLFDKRDRDTAQIVVSHPEMSAKEAVRELQKRNHAASRKKISECAKCDGSRPNGNSMQSYRGGKRNRFPPLSVTDACNFVHNMSVHARKDEARTLGANAIACCA
jgi:hypothetical protein